MQGNYSGDNVSHYHVLNQLGEGGMATIYKAVDTRLDRQVAIKFLRTERLKSMKALKRFELEARALAQLKHPHIVQVLDYGQHESSPYLVMEYVDGGSLKERISKPIKWQEAAELLAPIADALAYSHRKKIIHRDVKPSNILITREGKPMLSDFGVAKMLSLDETLDLTGTSVGIGTPWYMAPEQGSSLAPDHRVDVYSLGVVFYEMVTGRKPYLAETPLAVLLKHANDPLPRPRDSNRNLPRFVERVILKSMMKNPDQRYQDMVQFSHTLEDIACEKRMFTSQEIFLCLKPYLIPTIVFSVVVLTGYLLLSNPGRFQGSIYETTHTPENRETPTIELDTPTVEVLVPTKAFPTETAEPASISIPETEVIDVGPVLLYDLALSPDKKWLAMGSSNGVYVYNAITRREIMHLSKGMHVRNVVWSTDNQTIISPSILTTEQTIQLWNIDNQKTRIISAEELVEDRSPWSLADGLIPFFLIENQSPEFDTNAEFGLKAGISIWDSETWERTRNLIWDGGEILSERYGDIDYLLAVNDFAYKDTAPGLIVGYGSPGIRLSGAVVQWDINNGYHFFPLLERVPQIELVSYNDLGDKLAIVDMDGLIRVYTFDNDSLFLLRKINTDSSISSLDWSDSGDQLVIGHEKGSISLWDVNGGDLQKQFTGFNNRPYEVVWLPDSKILISYGSGNLEIWNPYHKDEASSEIYQAGADIEIQTKISQRDNMTQVLIPAGEFRMGSTPNGENNDPVHDVYLDKFWMDEHEVTIQQFESFLESEGVLVDYCYDGDQKPVACIHWQVAKNYCEWAGRRLPTEAEWEKAARAGLERKNYPWGDEDPVCNPEAENSAQFNNCGTSSVPVKTFNSNDFGLFDMAGNVKEWVADWYKDNYFAYSPYFNPLGPSDGTLRVIRGGSFLSDLFESRNPQRSFGLVTQSYGDVGFRCAESVTE